MRFLLLILLLIAPLPAHAERLALVIGNADFERSTDLPQTAEDARAMADKLRSLGFRLIGDRAHIDLTRAEMLRQIRALGAAADEGDEVVFYFSGHGIGGTQTNYLMPVNDDEILTEEDIPELAVDVASLINRLPSNEKGVNIFILDACRDSPLPSSTKSTETPKGLISVSSGSSNNVFLYAAEPGKRAYVSESGRSYFTDAFLEAVGKPGLGLYDLIREVRRLVAEKTAHRNPPQLPWFEGVEKNEFFFVEPKNVESTPTEFSKNLEAVEFYMAIDENSLERFLRFKDKFPQSEFIDLVNAKIDELSEAKISSVVVPVTLEDGGGAKDLPVLQNVLEDAAAGFAGWYSRDGTRASASSFFVLDDDLFPRPTITGEADVYEEISFVLKTFGTDFEDQFLELAIEIAAEHPIFQQGVKSVVDHFGVEEVLAGLTVEPGYAMELEGSNAALTNVSCFGFLVSLDLDLVANQFQQGTSKLVIADGFDQAFEPNRLPDKVQDAIFSMENSKKFASNCNQDDTDVGSHLLRFVAAGAALELISREGVDTSSALQSLKTSHAVRDFLQRARVRKLSFNQCIVSSRTINEASICVDMFGYFSAADEIRAAINR